MACYMHSGHQLTNNISSTTDEYLGAVLKQPFRLVGQICICQIEVEGLVV